MKSFQFQTSQSRAGCKNAVENNMPVTLMDWKHVVIVLAYFCTRHCPVAFSIQEHWPQIDSWVFKHVNRGEYINQSNFMMREHKGAISVWCGELHVREGWAIRSEIGDGSWEGEKGFSPQSEKHNRDPLEIQNPVRIRFKKQDEENCK